MRLFAFLAFLLFAATGHAQVATIDAGEAPYSGLPIVQGVNIFSADPSVRSAAAANLIGVYRQEHGLSSIPQRSEVKIIWQDKSSEFAYFASTFSVAGTWVLPDTQMDSNGNPAGGGEGGDGFNPPSGDGGSWGAYYTSRWRWKCGTSSSGGSSLTVCYYMPV